MSERLAGVHYNQITGQFSSPSQLFKYLCNAVHQVQYFKRQINLGTEILLSPAVPLKDNGQNSENEDV